MQVKTMALDIDDSGRVSSDLAVSNPTAVLAAATTAAADGMPWQVAAVLTGDTIAHVGI